MQNHSKFSWYLDNPISAASEKPRAGLKSATEKKLAVLSENHHSGIQSSFYLLQSFQILPGLPRSSPSIKESDRPISKTCCKDRLASLPPRRDQRKSFFTSFDCLTGIQTHPKSTHVTKLSEAVGKSASLVSAVQSHNLTFRRSPVDQERN